MGTNLREGEVEADKITYGYLESGILLKLKKIYNYIAINCVEIWIIFFALVYFGEF
jgi:hypothetical protein